LRAKHKVWQATPGHCRKPKGEHPWTFAPPLPSGLASRWGQSIKGKSIRSVVVY
jgi:hypothetical protein